MLRGVETCATLEELPLIGLCVIQLWESHFAEFGELWFQSVAGRQRWKTNIATGMVPAAVFGEFQ